MQRPLILNQNPRSPGPYRGDGDIQCVQCYGKRRLVDANSSACLLVCEESARILLPALIRPAAKRANGRYSVQWLSGRPLVSVFRRPGGASLEEPSCAPFNLGMQRLSRLTYIGRCTNFPKWELCFSSFLTFGRPSGERRPLNTDILLYANSIMYVILL